MTRSKKRPHGQGKSKTKPSKAGGGSKGEEDERNRTEPIDKSDMHNANFESYYRAQDILPAGAGDEEWEMFMEAMRRHLPTTFRVAGSRMTAHTLNKTIVDTYVPLLSNAMFEGEHVPPPAKIPWYPEGLAWQFNVSKKVLRKSPEFKKFHSFLVFETEVGNISRQEAVSMLPPLFMDVEPHHMVLDMCAAPGSKSAQLLEALHLTDTPSCTTTPPGLLIANDSDHKRCHLLVHQSARIGSPSLMVTNLDASIFPTIRVPSFFPSSLSTSHSSSPYQKNAVDLDAGLDDGFTELQKQRRRRKRLLADTNADVRTEPLLFDRILCDVPCSGDGTMRKNLGIWKRWSVADGNGLHGLQLRILQRAMKMLKEEGRIVYSTCSLNPVENEAVVAAALVANPDFELLDVSARLPALLRRPGLRTWLPTPDKHAPEVRFAMHAEYLASLSEEEKGQMKMGESHWPPRDVGGLFLERCMRVYPHLQDTGGFFVAVLQRKKVLVPVGVRELELPDRKRDAGTPVGEPSHKKARLESEVAEVQDEITSSNAASVAGDEMEDVVESKAEEVVVPKPSNTKEKGKGKAKGNGGFKENPYTFLSPEDPILQGCIARLNLSATFPAANVLVRNPEGEAVRSLYITNEIIKTIVEHNDYTRLRIVNCGTKVFTKQDGGRGMEPSFRILGEGLPVVLPYIDPGTIIEGDVMIMRTLLSVYYPLCAAFAEPFRSAVQARECGNHVVRFPPGEWDGVTLTHELVLPIWKSNVSLTLMIDKKAKSALSLRLFGEDVTVFARDAAAQKKVGDLPPVSDDIEDTDVAVVEDLC